MDTPQSAYALSATDLVASLSPSGEARVFDGVSLSVASGEIVDVVGPSGAGKTTLLRTLALLIPRASGTLSVGGVSATDLIPEQWRAKVTLAPQRPALIAGDIRDNLLIPWTLKIRRNDPAPDAAQLDSALASVGLGDLGLTRDSSCLSVGQQARVALLRVVLTHPTVLLLDEPDAALNEESVAGVSGLTARFASAGGAVVRVRHRPSDGLASRRLRLENGRMTEEAR